MVILRPENIEEKQSVCHQDTQYSLDWDITVWVLLF